jgi:hypothetical protein
MCSRHWFTAQTEVALMCSRHWFTAQTEVTLMCSRHWFTAQTEVQANKQEVCEVVVHTSVTL